MVVHVESLGQYESPTDIFAVAIRELESKADRLLKDLETLTGNHFAEAAVAAADEEAGGR